MYRHWFFSDYHDEAGDALRGILDNAIIANYMLSYNFEVYIKVLELRPSQWTNNDFWRTFDFDVHLVPVIDMAFYNDPVNKTAFNFENMLIGGGLEIIIYPERWRSLFLRISYARNFSVSNKVNTSELFIGMEHHY